MSSAVAPRSEVAGFVEAVTTARVLGWAWSPRSPADRVTVELRLGGEILAAAVADLPREDLARNGVGDGRHAFDLAVPEAHRGRTAELAIYARLAGGEATRLGAPAAPGGVDERLDRLQSAVDAMINSQRLIHRNLQAVLLQRGEQDQGGAEQAAARAALADRIEGLEVFMARLDDRLAALRAPPAVLAKSSRGTIGALGLAGASLCLAAWGLLRSLPG